MAHLSVFRRTVDQSAALDRGVRRLVRSEPALKRSMTVPGVGPITASFLFTIDDPERFQHARDVGRYLGLTKVQRFSPRKAWGTRLIQRIGPKTARVSAVARIRV